MDTGIQIEPQFGFTYQAIREIATEAETLGFTHLWVSDHFFLRPDQALTDCLEAWTLLSALTQVTTRLRLGPLVTCQSYRPPSLLAKMAAGVDVQSGGRLEFGVGARWKEVEYKAYGIPFPRRASAWRSWWTRWRSCARCGRRSVPPIGAAITRLRTLCARRNPSSGHIRRS